jgi:uncharacterized protein YrrD
MPTRTARELIGLPVFSVAEGQNLGTVSGLLVRREDRTVEAVGIGGGTFRQARYLRLAQLSTIGADAVMVPTAGALKESLSGSQIKALDGTLAGRPVVSESGQRLGEVVGFAITVATGKIEVFHVRPESAGLARLAAIVRADSVQIGDHLVVTLGANALILRDAAIPLLQTESPAKEPEVAPKAEGEQVAPGD